MIRVFVLNRSVRGFRFGAHYKPNDSFGLILLRLKIKELKVCVKYPVPLRSTTQPK